MSEFEEGRVTQLPIFHGDGYGFGGALIVSIGNRAIQLGPEDGKLADLLASTPSMQRALVEAEKDLVACQWNARSAAKTDPNWEGVAEKLRPTIDKIRAALAKAGAADNEGSK